MIKKERLLQLIKQGATIWHFAENNDNFERTIVREISLKNCKPIIRSFSNVKDVFIGLNYQSPNRGNYAIDENEFEYIFEYKEDVEEYAEFGNITKTERLKLPFWSDIFPDKENHFYHGTYNCWWDDCCKYNIYINAFITDNNFEKGYFDINGHREFGITKESYTNIRRYAVKLFYGEEV